SRGRAGGAAWPGGAAGGVAAQASHGGVAMMTPMNMPTRSIAARAPGMSRPVLQANGLVKRYGALVATDDVSLDVAAGEVHALIGPNGAGKSTLIQLLAGNLEPDAGSLHLDGHDVTAWPVHRRVRAGLARSFQITSV